MSIKKAIVSEIEFHIAKRFIETWHYSGKVPTGKNIFFGWHFSEDLYAVADYGIGVNSYQSSFLARVTGYDITDSNLLELKRLCRTEPKNSKLPLTAFISRCNKALKKKGYRYIVSFSDPAYNHSGGVYRASNFIHLGKTNAERHCIDKNGKVRHRRYYFRYARRNNVSMEQARKELGLEIYKTVPKDRWFIKI